MTETRRAPPAWRGRLERLARYCASRELHAFVVSHPINIGYLSGFDGSSGILVVTPSATYLLTDGRYQQAVRDALAAGTIGPIALEPVERRYERTLASCLTRIGASRVGFESAHVTVSQLESWRRLVPAVTWQPFDALVDSHRAVKDDTELGIMRRAADKLSEVARRAGEFVAAGRSEREVARAIDRDLERVGFSRPAFPTIVASGPNSALPHARPTDRRLAPGDLVLLDFGGVLDGYCVDLTRMAAVGRVPDGAMSLFDAVQAAQRAAIAAVQPGTRASDVDRAARDTLDALGFGEAFVHATGHGLGLEVHEAPRLGRAGDDDDQERAREGGDGRIEILTPGMVCTIEPGAYVEGLGGVRLEDDVLVTAGGCEVLTTAPRDLVVV